MHYLYFVHNLKCKQYLCFEMFTAKANYSSLATSITEYADFDNFEPLNFSYNKLLGFEKIIVNTYVNPARPVS